MNTSHRLGLRQLGLILVLLSIPISYSAAAKLTAKAALDYHVETQIIIAQLRWDSLIGIPGTETLSSSPHESPMSTDELVRYIGSSEFLKAGGTTEAKLRKKYRNRLKALASSLGYVDGRPVAYVVDDPIGFGTYNGKTCLTIIGIGDSIVYNTLNSDLRQRASKTFDSYAFELASSLRVYGSGIPFCLVTIVYGTRDFSDEWASARSEALTILASTSLWTQLASAQISDQEFAAKANVYVSSKGGEMRRVNLKL